MVSFDFLPTFDPDRPNEHGPPAIIAIRSRASAAFMLVFNRAADETQEFARTAIIAVSIIFVLVVLIALAIGITEDAHHHRSRAPFVRRNLQDSRRRRIVRCFRFAISWATSVAPSIR